MSNSSDEEPPPSPRTTFGRLLSVKHGRNVGALLDAARALPFLRTDIKVQTIPQPESGEHPIILPQSPLTPKTIFRQARHRLSKSDPDLEYVRDLPTPRFTPASYATTKSDLKEKYVSWRNLLRKQIKPVHCELLLSQTFSAHDLKFWMNQPFIGCSKPACYTCGTYLSAHPDGFVQPSVNPTIYPYLLPPPLDDSVDLAKQQAVWRKLQAKAERELLSFFYPGVLG